MWSRCRTCARFADLGNVAGKPLAEHPFLKDLGELKYGNLNARGLWIIWTMRLTMKTVFREWQLSCGMKIRRVLKEINAAVDDLNENILPKGVKFTFMTVPNWLMRR